MNVSISNLVRHENRVAVVTGGGGGIGEATCLRLATEGAKVWVVDANGEAADRVANLLRADGHKAESRKVDVTSAEAVAELVEAIRDEDGRLDLMVTAAGITRDGRLAHITSKGDHVGLSEGDIHAVLNVNLVGTILCAQAALRLMLEKKSGVIVTVSSVVARVGNPGQTNYGASKGGVEGLTRQLAVEYGGRGIRANSVGPGFTGTPMALAVPQEKLEAIQKATPLGRMATPDEIANAISWLGSDEASFVTGQVLYVDGGLGLGTA